MEPALQSSYEAARLVCRHHARSFYFSSVALGPRARLHAYAVYACCRHLDDQVDLAEERGDDLDAVVRGLDEFVAAATDPARPWDPAGGPDWVPAFRNTLAEKKIPAVYFQELLEGVRMDRGRVRIQTWEELDRYCYRVAGVVGLMMTRVFGLADLRHEQQAKDLGTAMQLTNILRDIAADYRIDRIYLPREELERFGLTEEDIAADRNDDRWKSMMAFQITRARQYYNKAEGSISALSSGGAQMTVWLMREVYAGILEEIEKADCDVFSHRRAVSFPRKLVLALRAWRKFRRSRREG